MALLYKAVLTPSKLELLQSWVPGRPWFAAGEGAGTGAGIGADAGAPDAAAAALVQVGSYRFDDPAGEVGIETILLRAGDGPVLQVPVTYRGAPLDGAREWLIGTVEHSVLGTRWVYDACGDPVYAGVLASIILSGGTHVEQHWVIDGETVEKPLDTSVWGSGGAGAEVPGASADPVSADPVPAEQVPSLPVSALPVSALSVEDDADSTTIVAPGIALEVVRRVAPAGSGAGAAAGADSRAGAGHAGDDILSGEWPGQPGPQLLARAGRRA